MDKNNKADIFDQEFNEVSAEEKLAHDCGQFRPIMIDKCGHCGKEMNVPEYTWELFADTEMDRIPCCSHLCQAQAQYKTNLEISEDHDICAFP